MQRSYVNASSYLKLALLSLFLLVVVPMPSAAEDVEVAFNSKCDDLLIKGIKSAKEEILVAIYTFTSSRIVDALIDAGDDNVVIHIRYDADQAGAATNMQKALGRLKEAGIDCSGVKVKGRYGRMHHKFAVIDRRIVLTGSFNYTVSASTVNRESLLRIDSASVAKQFVAEFKTLK